MHLVAVPLTRPPGVRTKPVATLQSNGTQLSKRLKRKLDDDDRLRAPIEKSLDDNDNDNDNNDNDRNEDNDGGNTNENPSWVDHWIDQPASERGRKNREGRLRWGKPEILKVIGITEAQYTIMWYVFLSSDS